MISKFRKSANNIFIKLFLGLITLSFVGIGGVAYMNGNSQGDIVSFSNTESISMESFKRSKTNVINNLQKNSGIEFTKETIEDLNINYIVLKQLINKSMINYLAKSYDFDISEEKVINFMKQNPAFHDEQGNFDAARFNAAFRNSAMLQKQYMEEEKYKILESSMMTLFRDLVIVPDLQLDNIINMISEKKIVDIISIDLQKPRKGYTQEEINDDKMEQFYSENTSNFVIPEKRKFQYLKVNQEFLEKKIKYSKNDLQKYFHENIDEFESDKFIESKSEVKESFLQNMRQKLLNELAKNLEEDVASGMTFKEIAEKYELSTKEVDNISMLEMNNSKNPDYAEIVDTIFEMDSNELSYPIEIEDKHEIIIAYLENITASNIQDFADVKESIKQNLIKKQIADDNAQYFEQFKKQYTPSQKIKSNNINITTNFAISKFQLLNNSIQEHSLPTQLLEEIIEQKEKESTKIYSTGKKLYFAYINGSKNNPSLAKQIKANSKDNYLNTIKEGVFLELMQHLANKNNMQVKMPLNQ